jgi:hypothetical protein
MSMSSSPFHSIYRLNWKKVVSYLTQLDGNTPRAVTAAYRADDLNLIRRLYLGAKVGCQFLIHKQADMPADTILFIDHAKSHAGKPLFEIPKHVRDRSTKRFHNGTIFSVRT